MTSITRRGTICAAILSSLDIQYIISLRSLLFQLQPPASAAWLLHSSPLSKLPHLPAELGFVGPTSYCTLLARLLAISDKVNFGLLTSLEYRSLFSRTPPESSSEFWPNQVPQLDIGYEQRAQHTRKVKELHQDFLLVFFGRILVRNGTKAFPSTSYCTVSSYLQVMACANTSYRLMLS